MASKNYSEKLKDPRWQKKKNGILERDKYTCKHCSDTTKTLHVHHAFYDGREPWEYDDGSLITLCGECHRFVEDVRMRVGLLLLNADQLVLINHFCEWRDREPKDEKTYRLVSFLLRNDGAASHAFDLINECYRLGQVEGIENALKAAA